MTEQEKLEKLYEIFEDESITPQTKLTDVRWDSMIMMSIALVAMENGHEANVPMLRKLGTVGEVMSLI